MQGKEIHNHSDEYISCIYCNNKIKVPSMIIIGGAYYCKYCNEKYEFIVKDNKIILVKHLFTEDKGGLK